MDFSANPKISFASSTLQLILAGSFQRFFQLQSFAHLLPSNPKNRSLTLGGAWYKGATGTKAREINFKASPSLNDIYLYWIFYILIVKKLNLIFICVLSIFQNIDISRYVGWISHVPATITRVLILSKIFLVSDSF